MIGLIGLQLEKVIVPCKDGDHLSTKHFYNSSYLLQGNTKQFNFHCIDSMNHWKIWEIVALLQ